MKKTYYVWEKKKFDSLAITHLAIFVVGEFPFSDAIGSICAI